MNHRKFLLDSSRIVAVSGALGWYADDAVGIEPRRDLSIYAISKTGEEGMQTQFYFVDVFADRPFTGNPLAIVPHADNLTEETMRRIAGELNQAETTFILSSKNADARLRSFTAPGHEVFGAGHNSLGAWWWLAASGELKLHDGSNHFMQEIGDRVLPLEVRCQGGELSAVVLTQSPPQFDKVCTDHSELAAALRLEIEDILTRLPAQVVSTGAGHLLVPVKSVAAIGRARPDAERLARLLKSVDGEGCYLYSLETVSPSSIAHARFFNPTMGIVEDAATGTAAGPLACQLVSHGIARDASALLIEQGYEMNRPSILRVEVDKKTVRLAGRCVKVIKGTMRIE
jgi:PhzF family phenazine biosynthesis protein